MSLASSAMFVKLAFEAARHPALASRAMAAKGNIGIRVSDAMVARLDRIARTLSDRAEGANVTRSDAARVALESGVDALERKLGLTSGEGTPPANKP